MPCPTCGQSIDSASILCPYCKNDVRGKNAASASSFNSKINCSFCGREISSTAIICPFCNSYARNQKEKTTVSSSPINTSSPQPIIKKCVFCQFPIKESNKYCGHCGWDVTKPLTESNVNAFVKDTEPSKGSPSTFGNTTQVTKGTPSSSPKDAQPKPTVHTYSYSSVDSAMAKRKKDIIEWAEKKLENLVKDNMVFIDTCSILEDSANEFITHALKYLNKYQTKIYLPSRCYEEVWKKSSSKYTSDPMLNDIAYERLKQIDQLKSGGWIQIVGDTTDNFADNVFLVQFNRLRMQHSLLLITQDKKLAADILSINNQKSVKAFPVKVQKINKHGYLSDIDSSLQNSSVQEIVQKAQATSRPQAVDAFSLATNVSTIADVQLKISEIPKAGSVVLTPKGPIHLKDELGSGGEASVYNTDTPYVAKIYRPEKTTMRKYEKIKLMLTKKIECDGICYPVDLLMNSKREFIGYLMPKAKGVELQRSVFQPMLLKKTFPTWNKSDTVQLCLTILRKIQFLHDRNIIMGDINPANILVVSPKEVYFVDVDSYQIEGFPCPVGTINFTPPEIQGKTYSEFLRTLGNERFAVATLLFMIMLPGKPPYAQQGGEDQATNIRNMNFSYPFGDKTNKKTPDGPWRFMWSHLTYKIKEAFYHTFVKGGQFSTEKTRLSVDSWIALFEAYKEVLVSGKMQEQDSMAMDLFPTRFKKSPNITYAKCAICKNEYDINTLQNGICKQCHRSHKTNYNQTYQKCKLCANKYRPNDLIAGICSGCLRRYTTYKCRQCGKTIHYTNRMKYVELAPIPQLCSSCKQSPRPIPPKPPVPPKPPTSNNSGSWCFITTAVCKHLGKPDDCYELTTLRSYRDTWLKNQPGGVELIKEYYTIAPLIVSKLEASNNFDQHCEALLELYIKPCIELINEGHYEKCKDKYIEMVYYARNTIESEEV